MALRVLLADESSTIKKVFQLSLQDFAVEVQPVNVGLDVLAVAKKFQPDIIFADVLLQKKNGYEVCSEIKHDPQLSKIPVVLMWSGFMELDEDKFNAAMANGHLEKPFDVKSLRGLINDLVPKTKNQKLSGFLSFPKMPEFIDDGSLRTEGGKAGVAKPGQQAPQSRPAAPTARPSADEMAHVAAARQGGAQQAKEQANENNWNMEDFDPMPTHGVAPQEEENFKKVPLPSAREEKPRPQEPDAAQFLKDDEDDNRWQRQDLGRFQINQNLSQLESEDPVEYPDEVLGTSEIRTLDLGPEPEEELEIEPRSEQAPLLEDPIHAGHAPMALSEQQLEAIIRAQSKEIIEAVVWKVVPEIATTLIERELKRLLDERDRLKHF